MAVTAPPPPHAAPPPAAPPPAAARQPAASRDDGRSITDLLKDLRDETTTLVQQEISLAKAELSEKAAVYGTNAGKIAAGGALAFAATVALVVMLSVAVYFAIVGLGGGEDADGWVHWLGGLIGGVGVPLLALLIGYLLIKSAVDTISRTSPVPEQTIASVKEDARQVGHDLQEIKQKVTPR